MFILENVPLSSYSTMRLGGTASYLTEINNRSEVAEAVAWAEERGLPIIMIGGGSNIIWNDDGFPGLVIVNKITGFETYAEDEENLYVTIGAGENWDQVVARTVEMGYTGIEPLSLIPGTAGATPIQNVGAYGREIKDVLTTVEAYDCAEKKLVNIPVSDCAFAYRTSRFRTTDKGRFLITAITIHLFKGSPQPPFYEALRKYFAEHQITTYGSQAVRDTVIAIRSSKLPDPAIVANNGSFFYNPIIREDQLTPILTDHPTVVYWPLDDGRVKVSAAWLLDQAGFKDYHDAETGMATWPAQPLVLVNEKATTTADLLKFKQKIVDTVHTKFGVTLEQEPELI
ncbi:MAG: UDP-N-acetylpyruvoylglucosamine reductase [Candidatus Saccharibacteria bacterium]|nr:UDP-N-acetylpyruvoylglucosamine reductase [Candidatus Saccharibacteria bacterium]